MTAWHEERAARWERALREHPGDVALLVWGDPGFYDSTLRLLDRLTQRLPLDVDVVPGISSFSASCRSGAKANFSMNPMSAPRATQPSRNTSVKERIRVVVFIMV